MINTITLEEFEQKIANKENFVIDFWAPWCETCTKMMPLVEELAEESNIPFYKVNIDEQPEMKERNRIKAIPMILMYARGRTAEFVYGEADKSKIEQRLMRISRFS